MSLKDFCRLVKPAAGFEVPKAAKLEPMLDEYDPFMGWDALGIPAQERPKDL
jgi:hypothetical protein